jgi:hypothetical protein
VTWEEGRGSSLWRIVSALPRLHVGESPGVDSLQLLIQLAHSNSLAQHFPNCGPREHRWSSGSAVVVLLD